MKYAPTARAEARMAELERLSRTRSLTRAETDELCRLHYAAHRRTLYRFHRNRRKAA